jgi:hypothetical protein
LHLKNLLRWDEAFKKEVERMRYLLDEDCINHCDYHQVCIKYGKLYRDGCILDGEGYAVCSPASKEEREGRLARLHEKMADIKN